MCRCTPETPRKRQPERWRLNIYDSFSALFLCSMPLPGRPWFVAATDDAMGEYDVPKDAIKALGIRTAQHCEVSFTAERDMGA